MVSDSPASLVPLLIFVAVLLFAAAGWCMISSCLGKSLRDAASDLWEAFVLSARARAPAHDIRRRRDWTSNGGEYEMEYRGRDRFS